MNWHGVYTVVVLSFAAAALSMTLAKSLIFAPVRSWISDRCDFIGKLSECPYCTTHWVSLVISLIYHPVLIEPSIGLGVDFAVSWFSMICISSLLAGLIFRAFLPPNVVREEENEG